MKSFLLLRLKPKVAFCIPGTLVHLFLFAQVVYFYKHKITLFERFLSFSGVAKEEIAVGIFLNHVKI